jgi:dTDP-4-dehydrorhamnose reductase
MKLVVLGAGGLLGRHVVDEAHGHEVLAFDRRACDITSLERVRACTAGADAVVNCAAFTQVDPAESHVDEAYRVNALGAENVALAARDARARVVHVSTDFVFDGRKATAYDEFDPPAPLSVYGASKRAGESLAERVGGRLFLVRVQGLYGIGGGNFASKLRTLLLASKPLSLDGERRVQPTWARLAARQILRLIATEQHGIYHVSCGGETTWAGFAAHLALRLGLEKRWREVQTAELHAPAARPANCVFEQRMLKLRGLYAMPDWREACDEYLREAAQVER